jgi:hypothetical protein
MEYFLWMIVTFPLTYSHLEKREVALWMMYLLAFGWEVGGGVCLQGCKGDWYACHGGEERQMNHVRVPVSRSNN